MTFAAEVTALLEKRVDELDVQTNVLTCTLILAKLLSPDLTDTERASLKAKLEVLRSERERMQRNVVKG